MRFPASDLINRNMGCIEIFLEELVHYKLGRLIETWDVLKFKISQENHEAEWINRNMGCIEMR